MTETQTNCIQGTLQEYVPTAANPWDKRKIAHLYARSGYGASPEEIEAGLQMTPAQLVDTIVDEALAIGPHYVPPWAYDAVNVSANYYEILDGWIDKMVSEPFKAKMTLFWHNHFVTEQQVYGRFSFLVQYFIRIYDNALGNFKTFTEEIGKEAAMLVYLNGNQNRAVDPNENYARELFELFTLGEGNGYTEQDIINSARALTGWVVSYADLNQNPSYFYEPYHDTDNKTIFGQTGNWGYQDVVDLIFSQRDDTCAFFICSKLYKYFVYDEVDYTVVFEMAQIFKQDWEIAPVMRALFKSEHFYDAEAQGVRIKDPVESFVSVLKNSGLTKYNDVGELQHHNVLHRYIWIWIYDLGQRLFNPVNVAGWQNHRSWITPSNYTDRKDKLGLILRSYMTTVGKQKILQDVVQMSGNSDDALYITQLIAEHYLRVEIEEHRIEEALVVFKGTVPENYFEDGTWNLQYPDSDQQIIDLLSHLSNQPEFELS